MIKRKNSLNISDEAYSIGVREGEYQGLCYYDYTIPLNNLFKKAKEESQEHKCMTYIQFYEWAINNGVEPNIALHKSSQYGAFRWFFT